MFPKRLQWGLDGDVDVNVDGDDARGGSHPEAILAVFPL
jgi:hypothetical protein